MPLSSDDESYATTDDHFHGETKGKGRGKEGG